MAADKTFEGKAAKKYHLFAENSFSWRYIEMPALDKCLPDLHGKKFSVLDAGCGQGRVISYLISKGVRPQMIVGVDRSKTLLDLAKKRFPDVKFFRSGLNDFNYRPASFNLIVSIMVLDFFNEEKIKLLLKRFYGLLKQDGRLLFIVAHPVRLNTGNLGLYHDRSVIMQTMPWGDSGEIYKRTTSDFVNATIAAGFIIERVDEPEITPEGKKHKAEYMKYLGPSRLLVKARK